MRSSWRSKTAVSFSRLVIYCLVILALPLLTGCSQEKEVPDVSKIQVPLSIERWDQSIFELQSKHEVADFLTNNPIFSQQFLQVDQYPHDSLAVNYLHAFIKNPGSSVLQKEIQQVFGDLGQLEEELSEAFRFLKYYYPEIDLPRVSTAVTGFAGNDLFVSDSIIVIGLDYYLGEGATFRPLDFPRYILKRYQPEYVVPSIVLLWSSGLNKTDVQDNSMLAEMVHFGKAYHFANHILPYTPDSLLIGYSGEDLANVSQNQDVIWSHFVDKQLLYETSHFTKKKYMDERPKTLEIGDKCPGRIGEWLGWEIVKKYAADQEIGLRDLMETTDARRIFMQSKYKPQVP